jgi:hypothetical protein
MTTINSFDKTNLKQLRAEFQAALDAVAAKHGLVAGLGNIRFDANKFGVKLEVRTKTPATASVVSNTNTVEFEALKNQWRVPGIDVTKTYSLRVRSGIEDVKFVGFVDRRYKFPFSVQTTNGKRYKVSVEQARNILHTAK